MTDLQVGTAWYGGVSPVGHQRAPSPATHDRTTRDRPSETQPTEDHRAGARPSGAKLSRPAPIRSLTSRERVSELLVLLGVVILLLTSIGVPFIFAQPWNSPAALASAHVRLGQGRA